MGLYDVRSNSVSAARDKMIRRETASDGNRAIPVSPVPTARAHVKSLADNGSFPGGRDQRVTQSRAVILTGGSDMCIHAGTTWTTVTLDHARGTFGTRDISEITKRRIHPTFIALWHRLSHPVCGVMTYLGGSAIFSSSSHLTQLQGE